MTRLIDVVPIDAIGRHTPSDACPCRPVQGTDLLEPTRVVRIHHHAAVWSDPPPESDRLLWRSRETTEMTPRTSPIAPDTAGMT